MIDPATRQRFAALAAAAYADGHLSEDERLVLHRKATEMGVPIRDMNEILEQGREGKLVVAVPATTRDREALLDSLIDVVCADGRIEPPEHHLLAKFASHLKLGLPELRQKVKDRMERRTARTPKPEPRIGETRMSPPPAPAPAPAPTLAPAPPTLASTKPQVVAPPGPVRLDAPKLVEPRIGDIPPVTLQLIRQSIAYEAEADALRTIERMLGVTKEQAAKIIEAVLAAFPDLKRNAAPAPHRPRR